MAGNSGVFITGGGGRLGVAIAQAFLRDGASVAICDADESSIARARHTPASANASPDRFFATCADVSAERELTSAFADAEAALGPLDALVTCAAVYPNVPLIESDADAWDRVFAVNVRGAMLACRAAARAWIARGTRGAIVNVSSGAARSARRGAAAYCASKAALEMMSEVLALEFGPYGIRVNVVAPGLVMDEVIAHADPARHPYYDAMLAATPLGRTGAPDDIAQAVLFLTSDRSSWTTGAVLDVSGGSHCGRSHLDFTPQLGKRTT